MNWRLKHSNFEFTKTNQLKPFGRFLCFVPSSALLSVNMALPNNNDTLLPPLVNTEIDFSDSIHEVLFFPERPACVIETIGRDLEGEHFTLIGYNCLGQRYLLESWGEFAKSVFLYFK